MRYRSILRCAESAILPNLSFGTVENRNDQAGLSGLDGTGQRIGAAWVYHAGQHRFKVPATLDQTFEPMFHDLTLLPRHGCLDFQDCGRNHPADGVRALTIQYDDARVRPLLPHHDPHRHHLADGQAAFDLNRGGADRTAGSGKGGADERGEHPCNDTRSGLALARMGWHVPFAEGGGPGPHIPGLENAFGRCGIAEGDLIERLVYNGLHFENFQRQTVLRRWPIGRWRLATGGFRPRRDIRHRHRRRCR